MDKTICELFAGVGGFRLGFDRQSKDWRTVWFSQWEPGKKYQWAHDCYEAHFGKSLDLDGNDTTNIDIAMVDKRRVPDHNLLVGGFPCQDYSVARPLPGSKGIEGKKGVLWWQIRDMLEIKGAPFCLLENVDRLLKSPAKQRGRDFGIILSCLSGLGYSVEWRVVNAADYGGAQRRKRVFIFAYKNNTRYASTIGSDVGRIIAEDGFFAKAFPSSLMSDVTDVGIEPSATQESLHSVDSVFSFCFENAGFMRGDRVYTAHVSTKFSEELSPTPMSRILEKNVPEKYYLQDNISKWEYLKGAKKIARVSKSGHAYEFSEGPIAFPDPIDRPARTMLTSEATLNRSTHIIRDPETSRLRLITPNEADRLNGFVLPDDIRLDDGTEVGWTDAHLPCRQPMPERARYFCMGNALVVPMITRMAEVLAPIIDLEP